MPSRPVGPRDLRRTIKVPSLYNGISMQPPNVRLQNQVKYAENVVFSVVDGASKRPGTFTDFYLGTSGLNRDENYRIHPIVRDDTEKYIVVYGGDSTADVRVFVIDAAAGAEEADVTVAAASQTYMNTGYTANKDRLVLYSSADTTFVVNREVPTDGDNVAGTIDNTTMPQAMTRTFKATPSVTITNISVAASTVVTAANHGLSNGQTVVITGSNSTPTINGTRVVANATTNTFEFATPVNVTVAGSAGAAVGKAKFNIDPITWNGRASGSASTNPLPSFIDNNTKINDIAIYKQRMVFGGGDRLLMSQADDLYNFWIADVANLVDTDPIQVMVPGDQVSQVNYIVPIRRVLILFTKGGRQFEVSSSGALSQSSVAITPTTRYASLDTRPAIIDPAVYFATEDASSAQLREFVYDEINLPSTAEEVSAHVRDLMFLLDRADGDKARIKTMVAIPQTGAVVMLRSEFGDAIYRGFDLFVYTTYYAGGNKAQSAWTRLDMSVNSNFSDGFVHDITPIANDLYILRSYRLPAGSGSTYYFYIERMPMGPQSSHRVTSLGTALPYEIFMDAKHLKLGSHAAGTTTWVFTNQVPLLSGITNGGTEFNLTTADNLTFTASGDYSAAAVMLGRNYNSRFTLSDPYYRDDGGLTFINDDLIINAVTIIHKDTITYTVRSTYDADTSVSRTKTDVWTDTSGVGSFGRNKFDRFYALVGGLATTTDIDIINNGPKPSTIVGVEYACTLTTPPRV